MPDSSTTNPSDPEQHGQVPPFDPIQQPDNPASGAVPEQPQKLKLKKLLTPLSPHLKAPREHHDADPEADKGHFESPHAVPIELEPEPPPPEPQPHMSAPTGPGFDQPLPDPAEAAAGNPEQTAEPEPAAEEPTPPPPGKTARSAAATPRRRRLTVLSLPVVLVLAILYVVDILFDPLGRQAQPGAPDTASIPAGGQPAQPARNSKATLSGAELRTRLQQVNLADYLGQLDGLPVHVSQQPPGAFIAGAFIPLGQPVNPALGLTLAQVLADAIVLTDAAGAEHRLTAD